MKRTNTNKLNNSALNRLLTLHFAFVCLFFFTSFLLIWMPYPLAVLFILDIHFYLCYHKHFKRTGMDKLRSIKKQKNCDNFVNVLHARFCGGGGIRKFVTQQIYDASDILVLSHLNFIMFSQMIFRAIPSFEWWKRAFRLRLSEKSYPGPHLHKHSCVWPIVFYGSIFYTELNISMDTFM